MDSLTKLISNISPKNQTTNLEQELNKLIDENLILKEENHDLKWWNGVYRFGYFVVILGLIIYSFKK